MTRGNTRLLVTQTDERLLELMQRGHERAFEAIVMRYRRPLLAYCGRLGLSDSRAEDALQQALLKAWLALQGGAEVRALSPWLYRIVHNTAINAIRGSRDELGLDGDVTLADLSPDPEFALENADAARQALTHVAALPSMQRDAIILSALDGRSHEEVARELGITSGAVRGLLFRARAALRASAAALTPAPLVNWASGTAGRVAPSAGRLTEMTAAAGGSDVSAVLLKGAVVAGSALLAAGVVLVPHHSRHAAVRGRLLAPVEAPKPGAAPLSATGGAASGATPIALARSTVAAGIRPGLPGTHTAAAPTASVVTHTVGHARSAPVSTVPVASAPAGHGTSSTSTSAPGTVAASIATSPVAAGSEATAGAGGSAGGSSGSPVGGSGTGSGSGSEPESKTPEPPSDDPHGETDDGGEGLASESEAAEREREAAQERTERETEVARERAEREAELAREREHPDS
jgi:RNA polymerase sigma factor (sigma-70 family)